MRVTINDGTDHTIGCVNLTNLECSHAGGVESKYGQDVGAPIKPWNRHSIGMERCRFTVQRWYKADTEGDTNLLYDLHNNDTTFDLSEFLNCITGFAGLKLVDCQSYQYRALTDSANDIIGEEIVGEGIVCEEYNPYTTTSTTTSTTTTTTSTTSTTTQPPPQEQITNGGFETGDTTGWTDVYNAYIHGGGAQHSGSYGVDRTGYGSNCSLKQIFTTPLKVSEITNFSVWVATYGGGLTYNSLYVDFIYTDDDHKELGWSSPTAANGWVLYNNTWWDLVNQLDQTKYLKSITIRINSASGTIYLDDVSLIA
jgi:hypothetical protein